MKYPRVYVSHSSSWRATHILIAVSSRLGWLYPNVILLVFPQFHFWLVSVFSVPHQPVRKKQGVVMHVAVVTVRQRGGVVGECQVCLKRLVETGKCYRT